LNTQVNQSTRKLYMFKNKPTAIDLCIVFVLGLVPLLWFRSNLVINSEDMALLLDYEKWHDILFVWNDKINVGTDYILITPDYFFQSINALPQIMGASAGEAQRIMFVVWFTIPGLSMYWMMREFVPGEGSRTAALMAVGLYMFNLYEIPMWLGFNHANICAYATFPAILVVIRRVWKERRMFSAWGLALLLILLVASGAAINPPLLAILLMFLSAYFINLFVAEGGVSDHESRQQLFRFLPGFFLAFVTVQAFWVIPFLGQQILNFSQVSLSENIKYIEDIGWLKGISVPTSLKNVITMQADWIWYQGWQEPYTIYSSNYKTNFVLKTFAWIPFSLVVIGLLFGKGTYKKFFGWVTVIFLLLSMGVNSFMEPIYSWLVKNIPFFWIIRSPWYKFGMVTVLGFAYLGGLGAAAIVRFWPLKKSPKGVAFVGFLFLANLVYTYPLVLGKMFPLSHERKILPHKHADVPDYVWEASRWLDEQDDYSRVITLPENTAWVYPWGFSSSMPAVFQFSHRSVVYPFFNKLAFNSGSNDLLKLYYQSLYNGWTDRAGELARLLGSRYILHERDVRQELYAGDTDDPTFIREKLSHQSGISMAKSFGDWDIYRINNGVEKFHVASELTALVGDLKTLVPIITLDKHLEKPAFLISDGNSKESLKQALTEWPLKEIQVAGTHVEKIRDQETSLDQKPITFTWHSQQMKSSIERSISGVSIIKGDGLFPKEENQTYWWLQTNKGKHFYITNNSKQTVMTSLTLTANSFKTPRSLYTYLNDDLLNVTEVLPPDQDHALIIPNVKLQPGENILSFYTPYGGDQRGGKRVTFGFKPSSIKLGPFNFTGDWSLPREETYKVRVNASKSKECQGINRVFMDGQPVRNGATLTVGKGQHKVRMEQQCTEAYALQLVPVSRNTPQNLDYQKLETIKISPSEYRIKTVASKPYFLIFNESYNPFWEVTVNGKQQKQHFVANGYANGYYIDQVGEHDVHIYYWPQNLFIIGGLISAAVILLFVFAAIIRLKK
jgi:hypothetical protein